jgi:hypothetical protein
MSTWKVLCAMAGVASLAFAGGDAAAAVKKTPAHARAHPAKLAHTQQRFHNAGNRQHNNKLAHTQQRFHNAGNRQHNNKLAHTQQRFHNVGARQHTNKLVHTQQRFHKVATTHPGTSHPNGLTHANPGTHLTFKHGPAKGTKLGHKTSTFPTIKLANRVAPIWKKGPKRIWVGGRWKIFVAFTAIPAVRIGTGYFWPDAYVNIGRPYCTGVTPDGCHLNWQPVNFEDGGRALQCVQYCPRPNAPPPPRPVALVPPPPAPAAGACELTVYSEPNFAGHDATTGEEQPALSQEDWQDQIVSIQVKSGVWDFFSEENYVGNNMRLRPGAYKDLGPEWAKKINSFMCVMTAVPGATAAQ